VQARIRAAGDHLVEITSASGAPWRRALEREERSQVVHGKRSPLAAWQTRESTRRACMALEASGFSGRGWRWPTAMKSDQDGRTAHPGLEKMAAQELLLRQ